MAKQKKNSNYKNAVSVDKKAIKEEARAVKAQQDKVTTYAILGSITAIFLGLVIWLMAIGGAFEYHPEVTGHATMNISGYGSFHIELYGEEAPETVEHFLTLATKAFFTGKNLHTYKNGLLYGGDTKATGTEGIKGEFKSNGVKNKVPLEKGVICMSRGKDPDSAYGQFFIITEDNVKLDGDYAAFAKLDEESLAILNKILAAIKTDSNGLITVETAPKITSVSKHDAHD